jgi:hypothetical protein
MKKHKVKKVKGIKVVTEIEGKKDREKMPRPVTFDMDTKYDRHREKKKLRKPNEGCLKSCQKGCFTRGNSLFVC